MEGVLYVFHRFDNPQCCYLDLGGNVHGQVKWKDREHIGYRSMLLFFIHKCGQMDQNNAIKNLLVSRTNFSLQPPCKERKKADIPDHSYVAVGI